MFDQPAAPERSFSQEFNEVYDTAIALAKEYNMEHSTVVEMMLIVELRRNRTAIDFADSRLSNIESNTMDTARNTAS